MWLHPLAFSIGLKSYEIINIYDENIILSERRQVRGKMKKMLYLFYF